GQVEYWASSLMTTLNRLSSRSLSLMPLSLGRGCRLEQRRRDGAQLHVRGALVDGSDLHVAIELLDGAILDEAVAAEELERLRHDALGHFGHEELGHRRRAKALDRRHLSAAPARRAIDHEARRVQLRRQPRQRE